jgi:hypothetical protein
VAADWKLSLVSSGSTTCRKCTLPELSPATIVRPSGATAQLPMLLSPVKVAISLPLSKSHSREGSFDLCQQDIVAPDVFGPQVVAAAFEQVTATRRIRARCGSSRGGTAPDGGSR